MRGMSISIWHSGQNSAHVVQLYGDKSCPLWVDLVDLVFTDILGIGVRQVCKVSWELLLSPGQPLIGATEQGGSPQTPHSERLLLPQGLHLWVHWWPHVQATGGIMRLVILSHIQPLIACLRRERPFLKTFSSASMVFRGLSPQEMSSSGTYLSRPWSTPFCDNSAKGAWWEKGNLSNAGWRPEKPAKTGTVW